MLTKNQINRLNNIAEEDFNRAEAMLEGINLVLGTDYGWLRGRVVWFDNPNASTCIKYAGAHDAYVNAID